MTEDVEWHRKRLRQSREELVALEAPYEHPDLANSNAMVLAARRKVALLEKLIAEYEKQNAPRP
jgi:hypothetical protein